MDIQGHRGARGHLPENTLPAFALALEFGVDTVELDVGVSRDGVVVVHHDRRLNPDVARGADGNWGIATAYFTEGKDSVLARVRAAGARSWSPDFRDLTPAVLAAARAEKLRVVVWTVNEPADILRMIEAEVDGIISDYPDRVIELSKRNKA